MAIKYLAGERIIGTAAERTALSGAAAQSWKELGRTTLGSAGTTISVTVAAKDNIMLLGFLDIAGSSSSTVKMTFNSDTDDNYAVRRSANFAADSTLVSQDGIDVGNVLALENFFTANIRNITTEEKLIESDILEEGAAGSGTAPDTEVAISKWANTSAQITTITLTCATNFDTGSELVVLGMDDDEDGSSGTNFWQQIHLFEGAAPASAGHGGNEDAGLFTPKKYLMIDIMTTGGNDRFGYGFLANNWTGGAVNTNTNDWCQRKDTNGSADTSTGGDYLNLHSTMSNGSTGYVRMLIYNPSNNGKQFIWRSATALGDAGGVMDRVVGFGKYSMTNQLDRLGSIYTTGQHSWELLRIWGSD